jgi:hypothetical protein
MADAAATTPPPTAEAQDPLPEGNWFWRRSYVFACTAILLALVWLKIDIVGDVARGGSETAISGLVRLLKDCILLVGVLVLFYMIAPSAEQVVKMLATVSAWKGGVTTSTTSRAFAADGSVAESTKVAGSQAVAAIPVPPAPAPAPQVLPEYEGPPPQDIPPPAAGTPDKAPF